MTTSLEKSTPACGILSRASYYNVFGIGSSRRNLHTKKTILCYL